MTALFDAHCHLDPGAIAELERGCFDLSNSMPERAGRLVCGVGLEDWRGVEILSRVWPGTTPAFGVHPWHIPVLPSFFEPLQKAFSFHAHSLQGSTSTGWLSVLEGFLVDTPAAWVGEVGLDSRRCGIASEGEQEEIFSEQIRLAARLGRRVNVHCVGAWEALLSLLDRHYFGMGGGVGVIVHGFGGPYQMIRLLAERGAFFTVGPLMMGRGSRKMRERVGLFPIGRILLESDAFLWPGVDAEDGIVEVARWVAEVRGMGPGEVEEVIISNSALL